LRWEGRAVPRLYLTLLLLGVAWPRALLRAPVSFYLTFSPLPASSCSEWSEEYRRFVSVARSARLPPPGCYPAPCPVECGLSSELNSHEFDQRSPDQPGKTIILSLTYGVNGQSQVTLNHSFCSDGSWYNWLTSKTLPGFAQPVPGISDGRTASW
jgi:hypothetical protein